MRRFSEFISIQFCTLRKTRIIANSISLIATLPAYPITPSNAALWFPDAIEHGGPEVSIGNFQAET
jgi:hypothetical protein